MKLTKWLDRIVEFPKRYFFQNNEDGSVTLVPAPGEVAEPGTPVSAENMNTLRTAVLSGLIQKIVFTESGEWLCPPGVTSVDAWVVGAGGNGGHSPAFGRGGGGGGGGYCNLFRNIPVSYGNVYAITVGGSGTSPDIKYSQFHLAEYRSNPGGGGGNSTDSSAGAGGIGGNNGGNGGNSGSNGQDGFGGSPGTINPYDGLPYAGGGGGGSGIGDNTKGGDGGICGGGGGGVIYRFLSGTAVGKGGKGFNGIAGGIDGISGDTDARGGKGASYFGGGGGGATTRTAGGGTGGDGGSGVVIIYYKQILEEEE